jgi:hypothetical protein
MNRDEAADALLLLRKVVGRARDDTTLQNWGVIWIVHAFTNWAGFTGTQLLMWEGYNARWVFVLLWSVVLTINIGSIFLLKSKTAGARTFIETQIWTIWMSFIGGVALTGLVNWLGGFEIFALGPVISILAAIAFAMMGGVMGRGWFGFTAVFALLAPVMALLPHWQFILLGAVWGICQMGGGVHMHRQKRRRQSAASLV